MKILLVNWQDRTNPQAGGAEIHLHEIFGRLAAGGDDVRLLCSGWAGAPATATLDGIRVTRAGTRYTFPLHARRAYRRLVRDWQPDVLVEDVNKVPLFTPRWGARRTVALVPHLFGDTAFQEVSVPMASVVWLSERPVPRVYRHVPFQAISQSTGEDLVRRGIDRTRVEVIYPGVETSLYTPVPGTRAPEPVFVYLGRLKRYKGVELALRAFTAHVPAPARLLIAGGGDDRARLEALARSLDPGGRVQFLGFVSEDDKLTLLRRAWALVFASPKEGWGITNLEAAACGTPVVASDSPGLRESVRHDETGYLVPHGDVAALGAAMHRLARDRALVESLGSRARAFAETFSWERAATETRAHLARVVQGG